ncbi:hypothetical protein DACRYDRAFT_23095, partial [Dacryopinax primogenitus]
MSNRVRAGGSPASPAAHCRFPSQNCVKASSLPRIWTRIRSVLGSGVVLEDLGKAIAAPCGCL